MAGDYRPQDCSCLAVRQAARHLTQFYDQLLAPAGLRVTQFGILAKLQGLGPMTINRLAAELVMDRTTLGRNILPLQRDGLIATRPRLKDRRSKELHLTGRGAAGLRQALGLWAQAQSRFETLFGAERTATLRGLLRAAAATELTPAPSTPQ
jgi:DNA-binding MarR family transcriptional regulator